MKLAELREFATTLSTGRNEGGIHESCFRSYQCLQWVRQRLMADEPTPPKLLLEIIDDIMNAPGVDKELGKG